MSKPYKFRCALCAPPRLFRIQKSFVDHMLEEHPDRGVAYLWDAIGTTGNDVCDHQLELNRQTGLRLTSELLDARNSLKDVQAQLTAVDESYTKLSENYQQLMKSSNEGLAQGMEIGKLQKQLLVIGLITAGKHDEAIQEILKPIPMVFSLDIRFADDASRIKAAEEQLESLKKTVIDMVARAKLARKEQP